jgi:hypothetical protein
MVYNFLFFVVLELEPKVLCILSKHSTTELYAFPSYYQYYFDSLANTPPSSPFTQDHMWEIHEMQTSTFINCTEI